MINNVYEIIEDINNLDIKIRLDDIKDKIRNDKEVKKLINKFNQTKELYEKYNIKDEFINSKKELMSNEIIKSYLDIQNEFNLLMLKINNRLNKITKL